VTGLSGKYVTKNAERFRVAVAARGGDVANSRFFVIKSRGDSLT